ncbi:MAG: hypothetical protein N3A62_07140 [Thermodesulfovibrionales bacterium]|nr:hypothetical protein [Thermodesulfovibrionales bacterium]
MITFKRKRYLWGILTLIVFLVLGCGAQQFKTDMFQNFYSQGWGPTAMTYNGRELLIADDTLLMEISSISTGRFYYEGHPYNDDGFFGYSRQPQSIRSVSKISGLAWESECCGLGSLWVSDNVNRQIVKLSSTHQVLKVFSTGNITPQGLAFDGKNLWTSDSSKGKIYKISVDDGRFLLEVDISSQVQRPMALGWDCDSLIVLGINDCAGVLSGCVEKRIVKINPQNFMVFEEIKLPKQVQKPVSLAVSDNTVWVGDKILNRIFRLSNKGEKIDDAKTMVASKPLYIPEKKYKPVEIKEQPKETVVQPTQPVDEAKKAADEAKKAADEAKQAAEQAKKAFELQQKK